MTLTRTGTLCGGRRSLALVHCAVDDAAPHHSDGVGRDEHIVPGGFAV